MASSMASINSNRAYKCVLIDSSSHLNLNGSLILLIDSRWTLPEVPGCAGSAPDQGQRLVLGGSSSLKNLHRTLECVLNVSSSNLYLSGYPKVTTDTWSTVPEVTPCARNGPNQL